ncbi:PLP-dependent aminotransferase family protein [Paenibacillus contaminans]|nr:PLP-dependent aminotransferase family protein [Paenibacillus contaminans]
MLDLTFKLDETSDNPLYMQIYSYIRGEIASGRIRPETKLPSIRFLAASFGISRTPIALAYEQLVAEGYVKSKPRSGLYAAQLEPYTPAPAAEWHAAFAASGSAFDRLQPRISEPGTDSGASPTEADFGHVRQPYAAAGTGSGASPAGPVFGRAQSLYALPGTGSNASPAGPVSGNAQPPVTAPGTVSDASPHRTTQPHGTGTVPVSPPRAYHASPDEPVSYDFGYGSIDLASFPFHKWRRLMNRCFWPENRKVFLYGDLQGEPELRVEIASYLRQIRGVHCTPEQIIIGAGTYHSLDLLFQLLRDEVKTIASEDAVNAGTKALLGQHGFECRPLRLEADGIKLEDVYESGAQAVYVTPSHQFPFGMTLSAGKRIRLLKWAQEQQAYIIENDYDGEFRYGGKPIPSLQGLDNGGRVVYVGTFSKVLTPSFRISYLVLPPMLLERFRLMRHSYDQLASPILQKTLQLFMQAGDFERHMRKMRSLYQRKRDILLQAIRQHMPEDMEVIGADSGLHILIRMHNGLDEAQLIARAKQAGVAVYPTSTYALVPGLVPPSTVLLGFGGLSAEHIREGIVRLADVWRD